jgi:hypothetical protein
MKIKYLKISNIDENYIKLLQINENGWSRLRIYVLSDFCKKIIR